MLWKVLLSNSPVPLFILISLAIIFLISEWLKEKGEEDLKFECKEPAWLDEKLAMFYEDALSHKETPYSTDILQTFRRSLSLYLSSDSLSKNVHISLAQDPEYAKSNSVLSCLILDETRWNISTVHERVVHTISEEDMEKIYTSKILSDEDPTHLLWKVWFDITYHLCKGRLPKNFWCSLSKHSLVLESDVNGVFYVFADYVYLPPDEEPGKMYATPDNPDKCPVRSTSLYLSKLSGNCNALFQCPKKSWNNYESWYWPVPLGREMLDSIISHISVHADLSKMYDVSSVIQTAKRKSSEKL